MADKEARRTEEVLKLFKDQGDTWAEVVAVVNPDGTAVGAGGGGGGLEPGDEVALTAGTLAALETTELGATTLAALETIDLGATSLAALETTELGATTLAALETIQVASLPAPPGTGTSSSVANAVADTTLLAANANRRGATIFNDDTASTGATLKVKLGAAASATSFTVAIVAQGYYEVPFDYTGIIQGYASAATGNARITEVTA